MSYFSIFCGVLVGYVIGWLVLRLYEAYKQWEEQE